MIEIKSKHGKTAITGLSGTVSDILSDLACMIRCIYSAIAEEDEECAEFFKYVCAEHIMDIAFAEDTDDSEDSDDCKRETKKCNKCTDKDKVEKVNVLFNQIIKEIFD